MQTSISDNYAQRIRINSRRQTAQALGVSERTLDRMIAVGRIKAVQISTRRKGIPDSEIERIAAGEPVAA